MASMMPDSVRVSRVSFIVILRVVKCAVAHLGFEYRREAKLTRVEVRWLNACLEGRQRGHSRVQISVVWGERPERSGQVCCLGEGIERDGGARARVWFSWT